MIDGVQAQVITIGPGYAPLDMILAFGSVWVANHHRDSVSRIDPASGSITALVPVSGGPGKFVADETSVWVTDQNGVGVSRIDPVSNQVTVVVGDFNPCGVPVIAGGWLWVNDCDGSALVRIDRASGTVASRSGVPAPDGLVVGAGKVWGASNVGVWSLDPAETQPVQVGFCCGWPMAYSGGNLWLAAGSQVFRVVPGSRAAAATIDAEDEVSDIAVDGAQVYVLAGTDLITISLADNTIQRRLTIGARPYQLLVVGDFVWVTDFEPGRVIIVPR